MTPLPPDLHAQARRRAHALRDAAIDDALAALASAWRRFWSRRPATAHGSAPCRS